MIDARPILDSDIWSGVSPASLRAIIGDSERFFRALEISRGSDVSSGSLLNDPPVKRNVLANICVKSPSHVFKLDEFTRYSRHVQRRQTANKYVKYDARKKVKIKGVVKDLAVKQR